MITNERKKELKKKLATMIDLAWKCDEFDPDVILNQEEIDYIENRIEMIMDKLSSNS